jgi:hypothetical protein
MVILAMKLVSVLMWSHALVLAVFWLRAVGSADRKSHVGHFVDLVAALVPVSCALVAMVMLGGVLGLPSIVGVLFICLPAGVVLVLCLELRRIEGGGMPRLEGLRLALSLCLAVGVLAGRGGI